MGEERRRVLRLRTDNNEGEARGGREWHNTMRREKAHEKARAEAGDGFISYGEDRKMRGTSCPERAFKKVLLIGQGSMEVEHNGNKRVERTTKTHLAVGWPGRADPGSGFCEGRETSYALQVQQAYA